MKKIALSVVLASLTASLVGCAATTPAAPPKTLSNAQAFKIILPNNVEQTETWNVDFQPFKNHRNGGDHNIRHFYKVDYIKVSDSELKINMCNTEYFVNTRREYASCVSYLSDVSSSVAEDYTTLTITPKLRTEKKEGVLIPISLPRITDNDVYGYLSSQKVRVKGKLTSKYASESIKGNFDRLMTRYVWKSGTADAAHRQFKDTYSVTTNEGVQARISAGFYPYRDGSIVEFVVDGTTKNDSSVRVIDWLKAMKSVKQQVNDVVSS